MVYKNDEERIGDLGEKIKKLEAQKKLLENRLKEKERKTRTRNLIESGTILQSIDNELFKSKQDIELFKKFILNTSDGKILLDKFSEYKKKLFSDKK
jgi:hypothetical protein